MRQTTIIVVAAATKKLLFISGFSVFSGFSGLSISKPLRNSSRTNWVLGNCWGSGRFAGRGNALTPLIATTKKIWALHATIRGITGFTGPAVANARFEYLELAFPKVPRPGPFPMETRLRIGRGRRRETETLPGIDVSSRSRFRLHRAGLQRAARPVALPGVAHAARARGHRARGRVVRRRHVADRRLLRRRVLRHAREIARHRTWVPQSQSAGRAVRDALSAGLSAAARRALVDRAVISSESRSIQSC